jgi:subtilase family serine protease
MSLRTLLPLVVPLMIGCSGSAPVDGQVPDRVQRAVDLGRLAPDTRLDFVVGLALPQPTTLHRYLATRALGDVPLGPDGFADAFAPTTQDYRRVVSWLESHGALVTRTVAGRTTVSAQASAAVVESLFSVELHQYSDADGSFVAASAPLSVGNEVFAAIDGIVGLSGSGGWQSHLSWPDLSAGAALVPSDMESLYGSAAIAMPGNGETVAILGAGSAPAMADVADFMSHYKPYGMTAPPTNYSQTLLGGPTRDDAATAANEQVENTLDVEMVLSMAPLATIVHVVVATNSPGLFTDGISQIVNEVPKAHAVTVSYGGCERGSAQEMAVMNTLFAQAQAEGQQWFFASGDTGTDGCRDGAGNKHIAAGWPSSSPYVIGVGGTMIGNGGSEVVWNQNSASGGERAGGGGPSEVLTKPTYQIGKTPDDNARDTPDIAAVAGGVFMSWNGQHFQVQGTSAATPICAGAWALVDQSKNGVGITDALTKIYMIGTSGAFNDITSGNNGGPSGLPTDPGYAAGPGYDLATGWGTPNVAQLIAHMP